MGKIERKCTSKQKWNAILISFIITVIISIIFIFATGLGSILLSSVGILIVFAIIQVPILIAMLVIGTSDSKSELYGRTGVYICGTIMITIAIAIIIVYFA